MESMNVTALGQAVEVLTVVVLLASVAEALVEFFIAPFFDKFKINTFWLPYCGAVVAALLVGFSGANLFEPYLPDEQALVILGRVLTALLAGRGSSWVHDFFSRTKAQKDAIKSGTSRPAF